MEWRRWCRTALKEGGEEGKRREPGLRLISPTGPNIPSFDDHPISLSSHRVAFSNSREYREDCYLSFLNSFLSSLRHLWQCGMRSIPTGIDMYLLKWSFGKDEFLERHCSRTDCVYWCRQPQPELIQGMWHYGLPYLHQSTPSSPTLIRAVFGLPTNSPQASRDFMREVDIPAQLDMLGKKPTAGGPQHTKK